MYAYYWRDAVCIRNRILSRHNAVAIMIYSENLSLFWIINTQVQRSFDVNEGEHFYEFPTEFLDIHPVSFYDMGRFLR